MSWPLCHFWLIQSILLNLLCASAYFFISFSHSIAEFFMWTVLNFGKFLGQIIPISHLCAHIRHMRICICVFTCVFCSFSGLDTIETAMGHAAGQKRTCDEIFYLNFHEKPNGASLATTHFYALTCIHAYVCGRFDTLSTLKRQSNGMNFWCFMCQEHLIPFSSFPCCIESIAASKLQM